LVFIDRELAHAFYPFQNCLVGTSTYFHYLANKTSSKKELEMTIDTKTDVGVDGKKEKKKKKKIPYEKNYQPDCTTRNSGRIWVLLTDQKGRSFPQPINVFMEMLNLGLVRCQVNSDVQFAVHSRFLENKTKVEQMLVPQSFIPTDYQDGEQTRTLKVKSRLKETLSPAELE
jgi:hypothetical protein